MARTITVGIDIGTYLVRVLICEETKEDTLPRIIGTGQAESRGVRYGYIQKPDEALSALKEALLEAEKASGIKIKKAALSISGITLGSETSSASVIISRADGEATRLDIEKAISESEDLIELKNKKILHTLPISYKLDNKEIYGRPEGMKGSKLEVRTAFVTCLAQHLDDLVDLVNEAGIEVTGVAAAPILVGNIMLTEKQRAVGCALVEIGTETVSIAVFENSALIALHVFPIGSMDITKDIALGFKIPIEEAEGIKVGSIINPYPKRRLDEIVEARLSDIFELVEKYLKKINRNQLLPAGIIFTGGGSHAGAIEDLAKKTLNLPSRLGRYEQHLSKLKLKDANWLVTYGLCLEEIDTNTRSNTSIRSSGTAVRDFFKNFFKQLLP